MSQHVGLLVDVLVAANRETAERLVDDYGAAMDSAQLYAELLAPAMREVGERWQRDEISVAEEHIATGLMEELLARDYRRSFARPRNSRDTIVMSCLEGERHVLGLRMCANLLEAAGFRVIFLGADLGHAQITAAAQAHQASALVLAAYGESAGDRAVDVVQRLRCSGIRSPIMIGGSAGSWPERLSAMPGVTVVDDLCAIVGVVEALQVPAGDAPGVSSGGATRRCSGGPGGPQTHAPSPSAM